MKNNDLLDQYHTGWIRPLKVDRGYDKIMTFLTSTTLVT